MADDFTTCVDVAVRLTNGQVLSYRWTTKLSMRRALSMGPRWAIQEMRKEKIKGRSAVRGWEVGVRQERPTCKPSEDTR
jgi:hypothetical protein